MTADPSQEILFEVMGQIATITFNRPEAMNARTWNMYDRLVSYCQELDRRDDIRVAILRGPESARSSPAPTSASSRRLASPRTRSITSE